MESIIDAAPPFMTRDQLIAALHEAIEHLTAAPWCSPSGQPQPEIHEAMMTELRRQLAAAEAEAAEPA